MPATAQDLAELLRKLRMDTTQIQARITDALEILATLTLKEPAKYECPHCAIPLPSRQHLEDHLINVHDYQREPITDEQTVMRRFDTLEEMQEAAREMQTTCLGTEPYTGVPCPICRDKGLALTIPEPASDF